MTQDFEEERRERENMASRYSEEFRKWEGRGEKGIKVRGERGSGGEKGRKSTIRNINDLQRNFDFRH